MTKTRQEIIKVIKKIKEVNVEEFDKLINKINSGISVKEILKIMNDIANNSKAKNYGNELQILFSHLVVEEIIDNLSNDNEITNNGGNA